MSKDHRFLYKKIEKREWRLVLLSRFDMKGKNYLIAVFKEAHNAKAYGGVEKKLKWLTDKFICDPSLRHFQEYVASCHTCQGTKYSKMPPLGQVTILYIPAGAWMNITIDFLNIFPIFTYYYTLCRNISREDEHVICFSRPWTIVYR